MGSFLGVFFVDMLAADCAADGESFVNVNMVFGLFKGPLRL